MHFPRFGHVSLLLGLCWLMVVFLPPVEYLRVIDKALLDQENELKTLGLEGFLDAKVKISR